MTIALILAGLGIIGVIVGLAINVRRTSNELMESEEDYIKLNDKFVELEAENTRLQDTLDRLRADDEFEPYAMTNDLELEQETLRRRKESDLAREVI